MKKSKKNQIEELKRVISKRIRKAAWRAARKGFWNWKFWIVEIEKESLLEIVGLKTLLREKLEELKNGGKSKGQIILVLDLSPLVKRGYEK